MLLLVTLLGKRNVTRGGVTFGNMSGMDTSDTRWANCTEGWQRLRWARSQAGLTQDAFAQSVGMKRTAYIKYEAQPGGNTGHVPLKFEQARPWAKRLKVRWEWLLNGEGLPWVDEPDYSPPVEKVAEIMNQQSPEEQERILSMVELLVGKKAG